MVSSFVGIYADAERLRRHFDPFLLNKRFEKLVVLPFERDDPCDNDG